MDMFGWVAAVCEGGWGDGGDWEVGAEVGGDGGGGWKWVGW